MKRKVRESNPNLTGAHFYRAVMSMYSGRGQMKKSYGERMFSEFGGEHKFPLEEKGYGLKHISEMKRGNKSMTRHTFVHPETGHVAKVTHVQDHGTGEKTASWTHHERTSHGLQKIGHGVGGEGLEQHLTRVHKEALTSAQKSLVLKADWTSEDSPFYQGPRHTKDHCPTCKKVTQHKERESDYARVCTNCGHVKGGESGEEEKSFGGTMEIQKAGEGRTMEWIAALFGYAEDRPEEDIGNGANLGKGPTAEWTRPDGWGMSLTARPTMKQFDLHGPDGALYQGIGKHELFTTLRKIHHGPWFTHDRPDMTPVGPMNAVHRSLAEIGESLEDGGLWIIKHKAGSKTVRPLSDAKKQQRDLAFRQYGSALRLKKPRLAKPPGKPLRKSLRNGGPVSKSACTTCYQTGAITVSWKGPDGELQKGYRVCPMCQNDGQPLVVEKGKLSKVLGGAAHSLGKKLQQFGTRSMSGKLSMPTPKSTPNASAKGLTVHMYGGVKGGQHQSEKVYPKSPADMHAVAERERKGTHAIHVEGPPHLVSQFHTERTLHHASGGAKLCPGCKYHAAVGGLKGGSSQSQAASA